MAAWWRINLVSFNYLTVDGSICIMSTIPSAIPYVMLALVPLSASVALTFRISCLESKMPSSITAIYGVPENTGALSLPSMTVMFMTVVVIC